VTLAQFLVKAASPATVQVVPVSPQVVEMNRLPEIFHRDPVDRLIVATARVMRLPAATRDGTHPVVPAGPVVEGVNRACACSGNQGPRFPQRLRDAKSQGGYA